MKGQLTPRILSDMGLALFLAEKKEETRTNLINHSILSHGAQLSYRCWEQQTSYPADYVVAFIHPSVQSLFLSRNVDSYPYPSILHTLTPFLTFRLLRLTASDKPAASPSTRARLTKMELVVIGRSRAW